MYPSSGRRSGRGWSSLSASSRRLILLVLSAVGVIFLLSAFRTAPGAKESLNEWHLDSRAGKLSTKSTKSGVDASGRPLYTTAIVLGHLKDRAQGIQWVHDELKDIDRKALYLVDDPTSPSLHLDQNHGREARVYLEYILQHYDNLTDITFFWHSDKTVWHNNVLLRSDSALTINRMNRSYVMEQGYVPSRCDSWPGCPHWITFDPSNAEHQLDPHRVSDMFNPKLFSQLFGNDTVFPPYFAETCCSQFAASRDAIRRVPKEEFQRLLDWIVDFWADQYTGMAMEMMWQWIFLRKGRHCPSMQQCYCNTYDLCMEDEKELALLDTWNTYRTRSDELEWQEQFVAHQWEENTKQMEREGQQQTAKLVDDQEHQRIVRGKRHAREKIKEYWDLINQHWGLPPALVDW